MQVEITPTIEGLLRLKNRGFVPRGILDIGAHQGHWAPIARTIFGPCPILMLEAQEAMGPVLADIAGRLGNAAHEIALLAETETTATFHMVDNPCTTGASLFPEQSGQGMIAQPRQTTTLDRVLERHPDTHFDFIKLDVQGAELRVLSGGSATLGRAEFILLEVALLPYNAGAPMLAEVVGWMDTHGFVVYDILDLMRLQSNDHLLQADILFVRATSNWRAQPPYR